MSWLREAPDGSVTLTLHIQPGAKRTEFVGLHGQALKVRLAAPPVEGKANACLIELIADFCKLPKNQVEVISGLSNRQKVLRIARTTATLREKLAKLADEKGSL